MTSGMVWLFWALRTRSALKPPANTRYLSLVAPVALLDLHSSTTNHLLPHTFCLPYVTLSWLGGHSTTAIITWNPFA